MGAFHGMLVGLPTANIDLRRSQFRAAEDGLTCLSLARRFVSAKVRNCRTLLRRNRTDNNDTVLDRMKELVDEAEEAKTVESLLGIEGMAARNYFGSFGLMLKSTDENGKALFDFEGRNRQPPRDPVNAMLSYLYGCLTSEVTRIAMAVGFDPFMGFYHRPGYGRASLALDLMEEFRPIIVDSTVLKVVNQRQVGTSDFERVGAGVYLKDQSRNSVHAAYVARLDEVISHPLFDYKLDYRRVIEVQARLLGQYLLGQVPEYRGFVVR
jgi:CRISPR-associated protein Cas1